jgi:hypothetical protein
MKSAPAMLDAGTSELFRTKVKGLELEAERLQQEALYDLVRSAPLGQSVGSANEAARANIAAYEAMSARTFPTADVGVLLDAFASKHGREAG